MIDYIMRSQLQSTEWVIGADPGSTEGHIVFLSKDMMQMLTFNCKEYYSDSGVLGFSIALNLSGTPSKRVFFENVHGVSTQKGASAFNENIGIIKGVLISHGKNFNLVTPVKWQTELGIAGKMEYSKRKKYHQEKASEIFPHFAKLNSKKVVSESISDALLIAYYGHKQVYGG